MMRTTFTFVRAVLAALLLACLMVAASPAAAQKEWLVHSFARDGSLGTHPFWNLVADSAGNLYGVTASGGAFNWGTVYELIRPLPPKTGWTEKVLYNFTGGADGGNPAGGLVFDSKGNLYGTASWGGNFENSVGLGVVFELSPPATAGSPWVESVLYSFRGPATSDGYDPQGELIWDEVGDLYGITSAGGLPQQSSNCGPGCGTVFKLSPPSAPGGAWTETILHSFLFREGEYPRSGPVFDSQGNLYGTTSNGGQFHNGVVYRLLRPATAGGTLDL
jgi:uncharacterized repeat protein (TIGR03803 family)